MQFNFVIAILKCLIVAVKLPTFYKPYKSAPLHPIVPHHSISYHFVVSVHVIYIYPAQKVKVEYKKLCPEIAIASVTQRSKTCQIAQL